MGQSDTGRARRRSELGGIISLAQFAEAHREALDYDLITRTHYTIDDAGGALSWGSLASFVKNLRGDSALARDLGKATGWEDTLKTNAILADIFDLLQVINANLVAIGNHGKTRKTIKPYPRPGKDDDKERRIGKGALPLSDMRKWIEDRRRKNNG